MDILALAFRNDLEAAWKNMFPEGTMEYISKSEEYPYAYEMYHLSSEYVFVDIDLEKTKVNFFIRFENLYLKAYYRNLGIGENIITNLLKVFNKHHIKNIVVDRDVSDGFWEYISKTTEGRKFKWTGIGYLGRTNWPKF